MYASVFFAYVISMWPQLDSTHVSISQCRVTITKERIVVDMTP